MAGCKLVARAISHRFIDLHDVIFGGFMKPFCHSEGEDGRHETAGRCPHPGSGPDEFLAYFGRIGVGHAGKRDQRKAGGQLPCYRLGVDGRRVSRGDVEQLSAALKLTPWNEYDTCSAQVDANDDPTDNKKASVEICDHVKAVAPGESGALSNSTIFDTAYITLGGELGVSSNAISQQCIFADIATESVDSSVASGFLRDSGMQAF